MDAATRIQLASSCFCQTFLETSSHIHPEVLSTVTLNPVDNDDGLSEEQRFI